MTGFTEAEEDPDFPTDEFFSDRFKQKSKTNLNNNGNNKRKEIGSRSCLFPTTLNKIDEVDESVLKSPETERINDNEIVKDENGNLRLLTDVQQKSPHVMWKPENEVIHIAHRKSKQRPKSANCLNTKSLAGEHNLKKRPNSSCASFHSGKDKMPKSALKKKERSQKRKSDSDSTSSSSSLAVHVRPNSAGAKPFSIKESRSYSSWEEINSDEFDSLIGYEDNSYPIRPTSACGIRTPVCGSEEYLLNRKGEWNACLRENVERNARKCRSNPNISGIENRKSKSASHQHEEVQRFRRSLRLLGLELRDFGISDSDSEIRKYCRQKPKVKAEAIISTKVIRRSVSLDCLREAIREAAIDDQSGIDVAYRRILAQAAYEEWYFKKSEEACRKREEELTKSRRIKEKLEKENNDRKIKAEEQFKKWIENKNAKMKKEKKSTKKSSFRLTKTKEEAEKAYQEWKKSKDKELEEKNKKKVEDEEKKAQEEKQKEEKRIQAEKAYQEWKRKLEEAQKTEAEAKLVKEKKEKKKEKEKAEEKKWTSFEVWKDIKDREIKRKMQKARTAARMARATQSVQAAERLYEAEQAFEEWLDKVDLRKRMKYQNIIKSREKAMTKKLPWTTA